MDDRLIRVGITHGDINGVGYEIILKALADERITELCTPVIFGCSRLADKCRDDFEIEEFQSVSVDGASDIVDGKVNIVDIGCENIRLTPGVSSPEAGQAAVKALEMASAAIEAGDIDVIVTAPICKETTNSETFHFPGHTEYLQERLGNGSRSLMILFDDNLRIALVTTHLPISGVAEAVTCEAVSEAIMAFNASLRLDFSIFRPKIAVLSLNPHCGDGGLLGNEEKDEIIPAIEKCSQAGVLAFGPFAADGFFSSGAYGKFDGVLACYHDQGLAPFKALAGEHGVNFTAGLPVVRTSPDHGTAFDIAWQGVADPTSMREAIYKAIDIFRSRKRAEEASANPLPAGDRPGRDRQQRKERQREGNVAPHQESIPATEQKHEAPTQDPGVDETSVRADEGNE